MDKDKFINYLQIKKEKFENELEESISCKTVSKSKINLVDEIIRDIESEKFKQRIW